MVNIIPFGCLWWLRGKIKSSCNAGDLCLISALGRSPGEGHGNPLQYSYLENPMDRGAWGAACSPRGRKESDATEVAKQQQRNSFQHIVSWNGTRHFTRTHSVPGGATDTGRISVSVTWLFSSGSSWNGPFSSGVTMRPHDECTDIHYVQDSPWTFSSWQLLSFHSSEKSLLYHSFSVLPSTLCVHSLKFL